MKNNKVIVIELFREGLSVFYIELIILVRFNGGLKGSNVGMSGVGNEQNLLTTIQYFNKYIADIIAVSNLAFEVCKRNSIMSYTGFVGRQNKIITLEIAAG